MFRDKAVGSLAPAFAPVVLGAYLWQPGHSQDSLRPSHFKAKDLGKLWVHVCRGAQNPAMKVEKGK